jgi:hypothetical protein
MSRFIIAIATALIAGTGCVPDTGIEAPFEAELSIPLESVSLAWSANYQITDDDGIGALIILDSLVFSTETGLPMDNIQVEVLSNYYDIFLIPKSAVKQVSAEEVDEASCDLDGDGEVDADAPDGCYWLYDVSGNQYIQIAPDFADYYRPNYMIGATDEHGVLRTYVYVNGLPLTDAGAFGDADITVMLGHTSASFTITASE